MITVNFLFFVVKTELPVTYQSKVATDYAVGFSMESYLNLINLSIREHWFQ